MPRETGRWPEDAFGPFRHKLHRHLRPYFVRTCQDLLRQPPVQALITDLRLAGPRTGLDAAAALRRAWGEALPVLVVTGDIAPERLQALRDTGLPWLAKPVMPMRLRGWLAAATSPPGGIAPAQAAPDHG